MLKTILSSVALFIVVFIAPAQTGGELKIYLIDVEGGNATLFAAPSGESILIDTGNGGANAGRDADRIMAAIRDAGVQQIDHLVTTHWHGDHYGAMEEVSKRIPIRNYVDHGNNVQPSPAVDGFLKDTYPMLYGKAKHTVVKPGDTLPVRDLTVRVLTSAGQVIGTSSNAPANPLCASFARQPEDTTENAQSVGTHFTFGNFRALHLGDLTANKEFDLVCPGNRVGTVDLFVVTHHGQPVSNADVLVHAIKSRVALMNNGTRKGGQPEAMKVLYSAPGLEDLWQLHFSQLSGQEYTAPGLFIANLVDQQPEAMPVAPMPAPQRGSGAAPAPVHNGPAYWIKVSARRDGSFTVTNSRNGFSKTYQAR